MRGSPYQARGIEEEPWSVIVNESKGTSVESLASAKIRCCGSSIEQTIDLWVVIPLPPGALNSTVQLFPQNTIGTDWRRVETAGIVDLFRPNHLRIPSTIG